MGRRRASPAFHLECPARPRAYDTTMNARRATGWTGGQVSIARVLVAGGAIHLAVLAFTGTGSPVVAACAGLAVVLALLLIPDALPPWTAAALAVLLAISASDLPRPSETTAAAAAAVALLAAAPLGAFGSRAARDRPDPDGGYFLPRWIAVLAPLAVVALQAGRGVVLIGEGRRGLGAAHLLTAALWLVPRTRLAAWGLGFVVDVVDAVLLGAPATLVARTMPRLLATDPRWFPPVRPAGDALLLYDGNCGLCHRSVRLCLAEAPDDAALSFAPLGGAAMRERLGENPALPDSLVLLTADGRTLVRSTAVIALLRRFGGLWRAPVGLFAAVPRPLRDLGYDCVARIRHRLFARPEAACPVVPAPLRARFRI